MGLPTEDAYPTIAIGDIDERDLPVDITGASDTAVISVALMPFNEVPEDEDYKDVSYSDDTNTALVLPFGGDDGYDLEVMGEGLFYPCLRIVDGTNVRTQVGYTPIQVVSGAVV